MRAFITIRKGPKLVVELKEDGKKRQIEIFPADKDGAQRLGRRLAQKDLNPDVILYSSSVDWPEDSKAPDLDFRTLIEDAYITKIGVPEAVGRWNDPKMPTKISRLLHRYGLRLKVMIGKRSDFPHGKVTVTVVPL